MNSVTQSAAPFIFVRKQQILHRINLSDLRYVTAEGNYCYLKVENGETYSAKLSLRQLEKQLNNSRFIRIHKSYMVNVNFITHVNMKEREAFLGEDAIPIGRTYISDLTERLQIV